MMIGGVRLQVVATTCKRTPPKHVEHIISEIKIISDIKLVLNSSTMNSMSLSSACNFSIERVTVMCIYTR